MQVELANVPDELKQRRQWCLWRFQLDKNSRTTKVPYQPSGKMCNVTDPDQWVAFEDAAAAYANGGYDGFGFCFSGNEVCGIDLDSCRNSDDGTLQPWAAEILNSVPSYAEISPSGYGVKLFALGELNHIEGKRKKFRHDKLTGTNPNKRPEAEFFKQGYFCITGNVLPGHEQIVPAQTELNAIWSRLFPSKTNGTKSHLRNGHGSHTDRLERCRWYVAKMPPAIQGNGGSDTTFNVACELWRFGLSDTEAWQVIREYNTRCEPSWCERELRHKLDDAKQRVEAAGEFGSRLREQQSYTINGNGHHAIPRTHDSADKIPDLATDRGKTEFANARRIVDAIGDDIRWCEQWQRWFVWDGKRWKRDESLEVERRAMHVLDSLHDELPDVARHSEKQEINRCVSFIKSSNTKRGLQAALDLVKPHDKIAIDWRMLDQHPDLLCCANGVVDLRTATLREHRRDDLITQMAPVDFDEAQDCPKFLSFLRLVVNGDEEMMAYLNMALGYALSGRTGEHSLFLVCGPGGNGKTTLMETVKGVLGDEYAMQAQPSMFIGRSEDRHPAELADLHGKRFVAVAELPEGARLNESRVKQLAGGDSIRARRMRENFWEFAPSHKLWLGTNFLPRILGMDEGIWRRVKVVPFTTCIKDKVSRVEKDVHISLVRNESPGILTWLVHGAAAYFSGDGLNEPAAVREATSAYRRNEDTLQDFFDDCCMLEPDAFTTAKDVYSAYVDWSRESNMKPMTKTRFGMIIGNRFQLARTPSSRGYRGFVLRSL